MSSRPSPIVVAVVLVALAGIGWLASSSGRFASESVPTTQEASKPPDVDADRENGDADATRAPSTELADPSREEPAAPPERRVVHVPPPTDGDGDDRLADSPPCDVDEAHATGAADSASDVRVAGAIRGVLVREAGAWTDETLPRGNTVMLDLVELREPHASRRGQLDAKPDAKGGYELSFTFDDLPEGEYELTLSALGSWRWSPTSLRVRPPMAGLVFTRFDKDAKLPLVFEVSDARTGAKITSFQTRHVQLTPSEDAGVFLQTGPLDVDAFPIDARFAWTLWADGYAAAFGDETAFVRRDDRRVADVRLDPGWSTRVLVLAKDPLARQARGAEVLVDGVRAGFTDAAGMLTIRAPARPNSLTVRLDGWTMQNDPLAPFNGKSAEQRAHTTLVFLTR